MNKLWDVCIMYKDPNKQSAQHLSTPYYNLPYPLARAKAQEEVMKKGYPKGTFYKLVVNGTSPLRPKQSVINFNGTANV